MPPSRSRAGKAGGGGEGVGEELRLNLVWGRGRGANRKAAPYLQMSLNRVSNSYEVQTTTQSFARKRYQWLLQASSKVNVTLLFYFTAMLPLGPFPANGHRASADRHRTAAVDRRCAHAKLLGEMTFPCLLPSMSATTGLFPSIF